VSTLDRLMQDRLVRPDSPDYDSLRKVWNGAVDRRPALIARCADATEVAACVRHARVHGLELVVRGGGHSVAGLSIADGALIIDLSGMRGVAVDGSCAHVGGGALNADLDARTSPLGLATTTGIVSHTGIGGLLLGGGIGWLMRRHGATCDNLRSAQLVDARGEIVEIAADDELLWALRGAGANFGVVTRFDVRLHPVGPDVLAGVLVFPADRATEVLAEYAAFADTAPAELTTIAILRHAPPTPWMPPALHGRPVVMLGCCWSADPDAGASVLAPLRALHPVLDTVAITRYLSHQAFLDAGVPHGLHYHWRSDYVAALDEALISVLVERAWRMISMRSYTIVFQLGGALADADETTSVFGGRRGFAVNINGAWAPPAEPADRAWVDSTWEAVHPHSTGVYVNFLDAEGADRVAAAYGPAASRLRELKRRHDPHNLFCHNHNIDPGG
jgi:FAD/FMN-containing dehydrogenase